MMNMPRITLPLAAALLLLAGCSDSSISANNSSPGAAILSPEDGFTAVLGDSITFRGQVSDRATAVTDLTIVWSSSLNGTLLEGNANSDGITEGSSSELGLGLHTITLRVVDGDGASETDQVQITVSESGDDDDDSAGDDDDDSAGDDDDDSAGDDDSTPQTNSPPSAPAVSIQPATPAAGDPLECSIASGAIDPEGDPLTYDFAWTLGGLSTGHSLAGGSLTSTLTVAAGITISGGQWTCTVTAHDGSQSGAPGSASVTVGAGPGACSDLNGDCFPDIVFSNHWDGTTYEQDSFVYWGGASGYSSAQRQALPTKGSIANVVADLNNDGYTDIVFANERDDSNPVDYFIDSYIYWGSASGLSSSNRQDLPTVGARAVATADLDNDGYLDLVFANTWNGNDYIINSYIYWGSASGPSTLNYTELPTMGADDIEIADLDADGYLDIVFANLRNGPNYNVNSYVYWGSSTGYSTSDRTDLPTDGATGVAAGDLDGDGYPDLVFSNTISSAGWATESFIYWGSSTGYSAGSRTILDSLGAYGVSLADVNSDNELDIIFANRFYPSGGYQQNSFVYLGAGGGSFPVVQRLALPTQGARASAVYDLDADGYLDIVFANVRDSTTNLVVDSYIYWGSANGYSTALAPPTAGAPFRTGLPTIGAAGVSIAGQ